MQGIMAAADDAVEANAIAQELAKFFRGESIELALAALMADTTSQGREIPENITEHWTRTDILITTCAPVKKEYAGHVPAPDFNDHYRQVEKMTCGDLGGIFLTREGVVFKSDGYKRIGMDPDQIRAIRQRGGQTVLIAGAQSQREDITFTTLEMGLMSVLVTDLEFAKRLLSRPRLWKR
jgi:DNA-binding transcriptional regulator LsrR (DeoR family)